ncbi:MAG: methyltransferase domain-containing protein [Alphaproteobacteria bacterium]
MARNDVHALQPLTNAEGMSRRLAVLASKKAIAKVFQRKLKVKFGELGAAASREIEETPVYQLWSEFNIASQERMWSILAQQIDNDYDRIRKASETVKISHIKTDTKNIPSYQFQTNIHGQPGGYMLERFPGDLAAGILYEAGGNIYALGQGISKTDSKGERIIAHIKEHFPSLNPLRILEMGCSAGGQTADYAREFSGAEIHAIDLSVGMLNYANVRTHMYGGHVTFHQADAGNTPFDDESFDLIISHNMFHEVAGDHMEEIAKECFRLLRPKGVCVHQDVPIQTERLDDFMRFVSEWQRDNNNEPFWFDFANADLPQLFRNAGFSEDLICGEYLHAAAGSMPWYVVSARR